MQTRTRSPHGWIISVPGYADDEGPTGLCVYGGGDNGRCGQAVGGDALARQLGLCAIHAEAAAAILPPPPARARGKLPPHLRERPSGYNYGYGDA